jgi:hypothetical protein
VYEKWSLRVALSSSLEGVPLEILINCPTANCNNIFLAPSLQLASKTNKEPSSLLSTPIKTVFYKPPTQTTDHNSSVDTRRVFCDACRKSFCLVCRLPWNQIVRGHRVGRINEFNDAVDRPPTESHCFKSCTKYGRRSFKKNDISYNSVARAVGAKTCPRCTRRVTRDDGCNHITCPCGHHWCFVCEVAWNTDHYGCRDETGVNYVQRGAGGRRGGVGNGQCAVM